MTLSRSKIEIDGRSFSYWESGSGDPVVYLHGFPTSGYLWREVMEETGKSFHVIAPDFPGFGDSELLDGPHTWKSLIAWVGKFTGSLGMEKLHLGVHDWGGLIGLAWACMNPERISSLLITDTSFRSKDRWHAAAQQWRTPGVGEELLGSTTKEGLAALLSAITEIPQDALDEYWKGLATSERRAAKLEMYRSLDFEMLEPLEPMLPQVAPGRVRIVWGGNDPFVPVKVGFRMGESLLTEVTVMEGASHFLQEDAGPEIGRIHLDFLGARLT